MVTFEQPGVSKTPLGDSKSRPSGRVSLLRDGRYESVACKNNKTRR